MQVVSMQVVLDGETSPKADVESGVPQDTVLGPLLFVCHMNDLSLCVKSQARLFTDDCLLYRQIQSKEDHHILQNDLKELEVWAITWSMRFNASKCYILRLRGTSDHDRYYQLIN